MPEHVCLELGNDSFVESHFGRTVLRAERLIWPLWYLCGSTVGQLLVDSYKALKSSVSKFHRI